MRRLIVMVAFCVSITFANSNDEVFRYTNQPSSFFMEFGLGYVNTRFMGEQISSAFYHNSKSTSSHGVDIFVNGIYQPIQYLGFSFGFLWEFMPIKWKNNGLIEPENILADSGNKYNSSEFIFNAVLMLGILSDIYKNNSNSIRLFAHIGVGTNYLFGGSKYEGEASNFDTTSYESTTQIIPLAFAVPVNFGVRFTFAKAHGIELVYKYELVDKTYKYKYPNNTIKTTISRDMSVGLRYVYSFQF